MSAVNCGCDPEAGWKCAEFPLCTFGKAERERKIELVERLMRNGLDAIRTQELTVMDALEEMILNEYQRSLHTYKNRHHECHALGLVGEVAEVVVELQHDPRMLSVDRDVFVAAGTIADMVKKATAHGVALDPEKLKNELGDVLWYITAVASDNKLTMDDIAKANIAKLQARYPQGFVKGGGVRDVVTEIPEMRDSAFLRELERQGIVERVQLPAIADEVVVPGSKEDNIRRAARGEQAPSVILRTESEPVLPGATARPAHCIAFACGCRETTETDGTRQRTYCPDGNCRRLAR